jgi:hypothetical protein
MEETHQSCWRPGANNRKRWAGILCIVQEAEELAVQQTGATRVPVSTEYAVKLLEQQRVEGGTGINTIIKQLAASRAQNCKARKASAAGGAAAGGAADG